MKVRMVLHDASGRQQVIVLPVGERLTVTQPVMLRNEAGELLSTATATFFEIELLGIVADEPKGR